MPPSRDAGGEPQEDFMSLLPAPRRSLTVRPLRLSSLTGLGLLSISLFVSSCGKKDVPQIPEEIVGSCRFYNNFARNDQCTDYHGNWTEEQARAECDGWGGELTMGRACNLPEVLGRCIFQRNDLYFATSLPGNDPGGCGGAQRGCEFFGGGAFDPSPVCGGVDPDSSPGIIGPGVFQPPTLRCEAPKPGEPPGLSAGGQVCTWEMISGATEEGRKFVDYASCDSVRTQRPYYPVPPAPQTGMADERMQDPAYTTELSWVKKQIEATACVCCHSQSAPKGPANWYLEAPGNFVNSFFDRGIAQGAGWLTSVELGAYPASQNNGFSRATPADPNHSIFVTTDDARMRRFFEAEAARRMLTASTYAGQTSAALLSDQLRFRPTACVRGEGVAPDGRVIWRGGGARYVYVMAENAASPTVPPNLDLPEGTMWRIDVPTTGTPIMSGSVTYGQVPAGLTQRMPASGAPPALVSGQRYYLYVSADVIQPITRCIFTAP